MATTKDSGFALATIVNGPRPKADPGGRPATKDSLGSPLAGSIAHRDWVKADMEYKENLPRPKYS